MTAFGLMWSRYLAVVETSVHRSRSLPTSLPPRVGTSRTVATARVGLVAVFHRVWPGNLDSASRPLPPCFVLSPPGDQTTAPGRSVAGLTANVLSGLAPAGCDRAHERDREGELAGLYAVVARF